MPQPSMEELMMAREVGGAPDASARSQGALQPYGMGAGPGAGGGGGAPGGGGKFSSPDAYASAVQQMQRKQRLKQLLAQHGLPNDDATVEGIFVGNQQVPRQVQQANTQGGWANQMPLQSQSVAPGGMPEYDQNVRGPGILGMLGLGR